MTCSTLFLYKSHTHTSVDSFEAFCCALRVLLPAQHQAQHQRSAIDAFLEGGCGHDAFGFIHIQKLHEASLRASTEPDYTQTLLHTETLLHTIAFTHRPFYTQTLLHTDPLHTEAFTYRPFYTQTFYTDPFTHRKALTHRRFYTLTLLHTDAFTHALLHTCTFTNRPFYT